MRGFVLFAIGLMVGAAVQVPLAQNQTQGVVMMNHVGIRVPNIEEAIEHYTQKMGYKEAFRATNEQGQPRLVYLHISQNTFLELGQASDQDPVGFPPSLRPAGGERPGSRRHVRTARARSPGRAQERADRRHAVEHRRPLYGPHRTRRVHARLAALQGRE